jgi:hypothetical protein
MTTNKIFGNDQMGLRKTIEAAGRSYDYFRLKDLEAKGYDLARMPKSLEGAPGKFGPI